MTPEVISVVLFDFDLTLADSTTAIHTCASLALEQVGLPPPETGHVHRLIGHSLSSMFGQLAPGHPTETLIAAFLAQADVMIDLTPLYPQVPDVVAALRHSGNRLGIVSTKHRSRIAAILDRAGLVNAFEVIVGGEEVSNVKPHPEGIEWALAQLGVQAAEAIYVGDSTIDGAAAAAAEVPFIGVLSGATSRADLVAAGARVVVADLSELPAVLAAAARL